MVSIATCLSVTSLVGVESVFLCTDNADKMNNIKLAIKMQAIGA